MDDPRPPVACSLSQSDAQDRLTEWAALRAGASALEGTDDGARMRLPSDLAAAARDLATREMACCPFLTIEVSEDPAEVLLELTSDQPAALPVVHGLVGVPAGG